jgi:hypothetical protein
MIYVVTLEDSRLWRNGIPPTVTLHANSISAAQRVNELMLAYSTEAGGPPVWVADVRANVIHHEAKFGNEVARIHVAPTELRS